VSREDAMSQRLLATKLEQHAGYDVDSFRALARARGQILAEEQLSATRWLFLLGVVV
jgi:hypothetical protein